MNLTLPERIDGKRVSLRKHQLEDASPMYAIVDAERERLGRWLPWVPDMKSTADEESFVKFSDKAWEEGTHFGYSLFLVDSGALIGTLGAVRVSQAHLRGEIGYWISARHEGQGYVTESVRLLEAAMFTRGFHRVEIRCDSDNHRSMGVPRRLGYLFEGVLRQEMRHPPKKGGEWRDSLVFSKLAPEYAAESRPKGPTAVAAIRPAREADLTDINRIYNHAVENGVATFDTEPRTAEQRLAWYRTHGPRNPILVAEHEGRVLGWASLSPYSDRQAYAATAEASLYIDPDHQGKGLGRTLLAAVLKAGDESGVHTVLARITAGNEQSVRMHLKNGFNQMGTLREAGRKNGRVLDVHFLQRCVAWPSA